MKKHGLTTGGNYHPLFKTWCEMRYRCLNPNKQNYKYYGGRGIAVCERWMDFANFVSDMGEKPEGFTLDRIDANKDYSPENCRWANKITQANNARSNRKFLINGEIIGLCEASRKYGVSYGTIWERIKLGWSEFDAITKPTRPHKKYKSGNERANRI